MNYGLYDPPTHLRNIVRYFWMYESVLGDDMPLEHQAMADGCPELIFQYGGGFLEHSSYMSYLRAPRSASQVLHLGDRMGLFGVRLYPHAIRQLLGIPNIELVNSSVEFAHIFGNEYNFVNEQMLEAQTVEAKIAVASHFFAALQQASDKDPIHECIRLMLLHEGNLDLDVLRSHTGLSVKQFERRFKAIAGFPPKYYSRITRFQATKRKYASGKFRTLSELSHACEYYDQSHFIREFKEFSGMQANHFFKIVDDTSTESQVLRNMVLAKDNPGHRVQAL
jgi:AraC-like DNA-binding protein